jgi:hypothetical protein
MDELLRVLAPLGVAWVGGETIVKPWPKEIDEWTHFLHGADNNAVAKDTVVGPPKRYQWISEPKWARSHDHLSSLSALVSARGRVFYITHSAKLAMLAALKAEEKWALLHVGCLKRRLPGSGRDEAMKERPNAQDRKISTLWQALFSTSPQNRRLLPLRPFLAGGGGDCRDERPSQSEAN